MAGEGGAAVLQVLVQNLIDLSKNEISLIRGLKKEAEKLSHNLLTIQKFLNDAETQTTIFTGAVKIWLKRLENAAFEADNVLDELHYHAALPKELNTNIKKEKVLLTCFSPFIDYARKRKMAVSIQEINMDLDSINESATKLGLQEKHAVARPALVAGKETNSFSADPIFIGRDKVVSDIVHTLITSVATHDDERVFSILPIVGMGGLGKTTLTRNVFNHQNMDTQFASSIWVHVSHVFDPITLFNKILKELTKSQSGDGVIIMQDILRKLKEALKDKTYLLVLDDVWNEDVSKWENFLHSLLGVTNTKGNGIIVTTRSTGVASIVYSNRHKMNRTLPIHHLKGLSKEDCWSIISKKTFGNEGIVPLDIESIGREIAERCGGLPLAASLVGGVLGCDKSVHKWESIRDDWLPEGENDITQILKLSFNNLSSPSLKKCFAYCSIFTKGIHMSKQELIELWMAEGFLQADGGDDMESVGDKFYNVLLHSSLLQKVNINYLPQDDEYCVMHDLVHDVASSVLGYSNNADGITRVRYKLIRGESSRITKEVAQHLRTLIFQVSHEYQHKNIIFSDFKCLHNLTLTSIKEFPTSIRKLIHLRNLHISHTVITQLPDWIGELHHLQIFRVPMFVGKLPSTIKYLINLRLLDVHIRVELPAEIARLTYLQTLWRNFIVRNKNGYKIKELGSLDNLKGSLTIECLEKVHDKEEAEKANLSKKSKLSKLCLVWTSNRSEEVESINDENVLEGLQPHSNLKKLKIEEFRGKRFPEWTLKMAVRNEPQGSWIGLNHLVGIKFFHCTKCEEIPMLGHLPNLKSLKMRYLRNVKSINSSFYGIGNETGVAFPALETLELFGMDSLKEWAEVESGSTSEVKVFPHLRSLKISNCNQLMTVPINIHFSSCLKSLEISGCNQLTTDSYLPLLSKLTSLTSLVLEGLESIPVELFDNNPYLSVLKLRRCPKLREIPDGLQTFNYLKELIIEECPDLKRIGCPRIKEYHGFMGYLTQLGIRECHGLMDFPYELLESQALEKVALEGLSSLSNLPRVIECLAKSAATLTELTIVGVPKFLATSVDQVWHFPNLQKLKIDVSMEGSTDTSVATLDRIFQGCRCNRLRRLYLTGIDSCNQLMTVPINIHFLSYLRSLEISGCNHLTTDSYLPLLSMLTSLEDLVLEGLNGLESLPDELFDNNPNLSVLKISGCPKLREIPDGLQTLNSLKKLTIDKCSDLKRIGCSSGGSFTSLAELSIRECHELMDFPYEMVESLALKALVLKGLSSLSNLPSVIECLAKSAAHLTELTIVGVPKFLATSVDQVWRFPELQKLNIDVSMEGSTDTSVATMDRILQGCSCDRLYQLYLTGMDS